MCVGQWRMFLQGELKMETTIKAGDNVRTIYGKIETVMAVETSRIITYESMRTQAWYHPTKVRKIS